MLQIRTAGQLRSRRNRNGPNYPVGTVVSAKSRLESFYSGQSDHANHEFQCDRVQPCTACSLHQIAHECTYDLTEQERHPILQAEALRNKDKEIERLRNELAQRSCGQFIPDNPEMSGSNHCPPPHSLRGLPTVYQHCDGAYDDRETMMTRSISVTQEVSSSVVALAT